MQPTTEAALSPFMQSWMTPLSAATIAITIAMGTCSRGGLNVFRFNRTAISYRVAGRSSHPVRAGLVEHAREWPWSSLRFPQMSDPVPVETPTEWLDGIDHSPFEHELTTPLRCVNRRQPYGAEDWQATVATTLGLESTLRGRGRPRKLAAKQPVPFPLPRFVTFVKHQRQRGSRIEP